MRKLIVKLKVDPEALSQIAGQVKLSAPKPVRPKSRLVSSSSPPPTLSRSQSPTSKRSKNGRGTKRHSVTPSQSFSNIPSIISSRSNTPSVTQSRPFGFQGNNMRIGGPTMNTHTTTHLDKSGKPCAKWIKNDNTRRIIRTFSGFELDIDSWQRVGGPKNTDKKKKPLTTKGPAVKVT
ncbi:DEKNAAC100956 [Brettanomyces naardenensis]|uniref:DEKNAAC100956 n=1 Tax=Brettanomyces naardenensis TaxID=13370 RepID=A0A448YGT5_BRENA|nr:DEKNAAC100956 [Brettanomyces naardenensis]